MYVLLDLSHLSANNRPDKIFRPQVLLPSSISGMCNSMINVRRYETTPFESLNPLF